ncbi:LysR substrate-binding domain-containing protein [Sulfitobacter dubius]|uniref:LysR substrate-binding domain-containing protein n=1 Tax=Sulfitobacter dubius TaxID=218673 RepID=UPI0008E54C96|nr:LysR substrate-binding domain-containing protein [Sulfitobacter dubius]SFG39387.1 DNA-binding transcriptional regulator, LysR family [Sulfitobacter dubius]
MTLEQLRIFIAVAEREHVTQAAAYLNLTQSATSAAVAALEERHAVRLFDRVGRRVVLTDSGKLFLSEARAVVARAEQAKRLLGDLAGMKRGTLRLGASQTIANYWLPPLMQRFREHHPGISLELSVGNSTLVAQMVHDATVDLGFVEGEITDAALTSQSLPGDQLALVVAPGHDWQCRPPSAPEDLKASPWVMREAGSGTRSACEKALLDQGLCTDDIEIAFELPSNEALCVAVEAGAGAAILSTLVVGRAIKANRLVSVNFRLPQRQFHVLRHKERHLSLAEQKFLELI